MLQNCPPKVSCEPCHPNSGKKSVRSTSSLRVYGTKHAEEPNYWEPSFPRGGREPQVRPRATRGAAKNTRGAGRGTKQQSSSSNNQPANSLSAAAQRSPPLRTLREDRYTITRGGDEPSRLAESRPSSAAGRLDRKLSSSNKRMSACVTQGRDERKREKGGEGGREGEAHREVGRNTSA